MGWGKISTLCSLKAIAIACFLTPATTVLPTTPALAQFTIVIPGFGGVRVHGRRYYGRRHGRYSRYSRRGRRGGAGEEPGEVSTPPSNTAPTGAGAGSAAVTAPPTGSGNKKMRGTSDD